MKHYCILFAGPAGSGKTPIANYLSYKLNLPVFNNDSIRTEVREDLQSFDQAEYEQRRKSRLDEIIKSKISFIYDASIDRRWAELKNHLLENSYQYFIVSLNFSKEKLEELYKIKDYKDLKALDRTFNDHQSFLGKFSPDVSVNLGDAHFPDRLNYALTEIQKIIESY